LKLESCLAPAPSALWTSLPLPTISQHRLVFTPRVSFISVEVSPVHTSLSKALALFLIDTKK